MALRSTSPFLWLGSLLGVLRPTAPQLPSSQPSSQLPAPSSQLPAPSSLCLPPHSFFLRVVTSITERASASAPAVQQWVVRVAFCAGDGRGPCGAFLCHACCRSPLPAGWKYAMAAARTSLLRFHLSLCRLWSDGYASRCVWRLHSGAHKHESMDDH